MTAMEAKFDALMNKMGNQDKRMHSTREVGIIDDSEKRNSVEEGLTHKGPYQVEEAQYPNANISYNFKSNLNLTSHYTAHSGTMRISQMEVEHNKVRDLGRIFNNIMFHLGSNNNNKSNREVREHKIRDRGYLFPLRNIC